MWTGEEVFAGAVFIIAVAIIVMSILEAYGINTPLHGLLVAIGIKDNYVVNYRRYYRYPYYGKRRIWYNYYYPWYYTNPYIWYSNYRPIFYA